MWLAVHFVRANGLTQKTFEEMQLSNFTDGLEAMLRESNSKGENFFHEVTRSGSFSLIERFLPFIKSTDCFYANYIISSYVWKKL